MLMHIAFTSTTLDTDELLMPVQLITAPSRALVTFFIFFFFFIFIGSAPEEESRENVKLAEFIIIGEIVGV